MRSRSYGGSLASNWRLKLSAFFLAVFLWALVRVGSPDQRAVSIPVIVSLNDPDWILMDDPVPATVEVRFSGPPTEVFRLTAIDGVSITVPVTEVAGEEMVIALQAAWIPVDGYPGVTVEDILPSTVHVHLDHVETASIPVRITTRGSLPEHLALIRVNPELTFQSPLPRVMISEGWTGRSCLLSQFRCTREVLRVTR